jgi:aspartyl/glutamyl-tRNA(Asn/Gln) amidotransferase C subunit
MNIQDLEKLAETAKIELTEAEKQQLPKDMEIILAYVKQVNETELPDEKIEYSHRNIWREDNDRAPGEPDFSLDIITGQFPQSLDGFVKVKKIM